MNKIFCRICDKIIELNNIFIFLFLSFLFHSCLSEKENKKTTMYTKKIKNKQLLKPVEGNNILKCYKYGDSTVSIKICLRGYTEGLPKKPSLRFPRLKKEAISFLKEKRVIPIYSHIDIDYSYRPFVYDRPDYGTGLWYAPYAFYEISIKKNKEIIQKTGRLYHIGPVAIKTNSVLSQQEPLPFVDIQSGVYMSDTSKNFGCFILTAPYLNITPIHKYVVDSYTISSLDSLAQILCGKYTHMGIMQKEIEIK